MTRQLSKGTCTFCRAEYSKSGMIRHLAACMQRASVEAPMEDHQTGGKNSIFHLLVEGRRLPMYWLHLDVTSETTLATLDRFLRDIWLECCGHLSAFEIAGAHYTVDEGLIDDDFWSRRQKNMHVRLDEVLHSGQTFSYEYDFGSTTALTLKVISQREATVQGAPIQVLARNNPSPVSCDRCGKPATVLCSQCSYEGQGNLCDTCAKEHPCGQEMLLPLVNSPREGVCGYTGMDRAYSW